jgi:hypothetical protein
MPLYKEDFLVKTLQVQYPNSASHYHFLYTGTRPVAAGDWAVVHTRGSFHVVEIKRVRPGIDSHVTKPVIGVITKADYEAYEVGRQNIESIRQKFEEMDYLIEEEQKLSKYREAAATNPRIADLLRQVDQFTGADVLPAPTPTPAEDEKQEPGQPVETVYGDATPEVEPIPQGWFYEYATGKFHDRHFSVAAPEFTRKWLPRKDEFPTEHAAIYATDPDPSGLWNE